MLKEHQDQIIELVKLANSGNHYNSLKELSAFSLDDIYHAINNYPSMMGNFYEIVLKLHYFLRLHGWAGELVNIDRGARKAPTKLDTFDKLVGGGSGGGAVDICHLEFNDRAVIGITSKYKKAETLSLADLEFLAICSSIDNNFPHIKKRYYGILIRNKSQIEHLFKTGELKEEHVIYDFEDAKKWWNDIQIFLLNHPNQTVANIEQEIRSHKAVYIILRDEQFEGVRKAKRYFMNGGKDFLMNAKMRYGKICASYEIAKRINAKTVLMATFFPSVSSQWVEDSKNFANFLNIRTINSIDFDSKHPISIERRNPDEIIVVLTSYQDFKESRNKRKWKNIIDHEWDIVISDEFHFGVESEQTLSFLEDVKYKHHLALSGTPVKALLRGTFTPDNTYTWSYIDEQRKKREGKQEYKWLPTMHMHTINIPLGIQQELNMYGEDEGFTLNKLFSTKDKEFLYEDTVIRFLDMLSGESGFRKEVSPFSYGSTKSNGLRHTVWYMPDVQSCYALEKVMVNHHFFKKFKVITINSQKYQAKDVLDVVRNVTNVAERESYRGSITLAYKQLSTGSSVPKWSGVFMLNSGHSLESYMQTIFRAQTPNKDDNKQECHVFDFNPSRCLQVLYEFASINSTTDKEKYLREWLEFCPLLTHDENTIKRIDIESFLKNFSVHGNHSRIFGHERSINANNLTDDLRVIIGTIEASSRRLDFGPITSTVIDAGKNYVPIKKDKKNSEEVSQDKKDKERLKTIAATIPWLLLFVDNRFNTITESLDAISGDKMHAYEERVGLKINDIKLLLQAKSLDMEYIDRQILSFNHAIHENRNNVIEKMLLDSNNDVNLSEYGEVTTNSELIRRMFVKLPPNVWSNPSLKWIDLACGTGSFLLIVFEKLMDGLKGIIEDSDARARHILNNMLYGVDIRKSNITLAGIRLKYGDIIPTNLFVTDSLKHNFDIKFDVIISNPPYKNGIYAHMVRKALDIASEGAYLEFILPPNWVVPGKFSLLDDVFKYTVRHLEINTINNYFPGRCGYTWFCLHKKASDDNTNTTYMSKFDNRIYHGHGNINLRIGFIPKLLCNDSLSILNKVKTHSGSRLDIIRFAGYNMKQGNKKTSSSPTETHCYPYAHTSANDWEIRCWGSEPHVCQYDSKVLVSAIGFIKPFYDPGTLGFTEHSFAIMVDDAERGRRLVSILSSSLYVFIQKIANTQFGRMQNPEFYRFMPILDLGRDWTDIEIYNEFNLTEKEIKLIESMKEHMDV